MLDAQRRATVTDVTYELTPYCDGTQPRMKAGFDGYEPGTVAFVTLGGAPPLDLVMGEPVDAQWNGGAYGIYIRTPDGTVVTDTLEHFACCAPDEVG